MKVKMLMVAAALLMFASLALAQPPSPIVWWNNGDDPDWGDGFPLKKACPGHPGGDELLPNGVPVWIMWDSNSNGPDLGDPLPVLCNNPPVCADGPSQTHNRQWFPIGGGSTPVNHGWYIDDPAFRCVAQLANPPLYYLRCSYAETLDVAPYVKQVRMVRWHSRVVINGAGVPQEEPMNTPEDWSCWDSTYTYSTQPPCTPDVETWFYPQPPQGGPQFFTDCIVLCAPTTHTVYVGPLMNPNRVPHGFVFPGCMPINTPCDSMCEPAQGWNFGPLVFTLVQLPGGMYYAAQIVAGTGATDGCACVHIDFIESVDMGEVAITPYSNQVKLAWTTLAETDLVSFRIYRNSTLVGTKEAANSASGASYEFVDNGVENGRTYTYELRAVDMNGNEEVVYTGEASPSFDNALVTEYALHQNYPNPFNPTTKIAFDLVDNNTVTLTVYNATGQVVATLLNGANYTKGRHSLTFDSGNLTSGLYFYTVKIGNEFTATKKMLLVK